MSLQVIFRSILSPCLYNQRNSFACILLLRFCKTQHDLKKNSLTRNNECWKMLKSTFTSWISISPPMIQFTMKQNWLDCQPLVKQLTLWCWTFWILLELNIFHLEESFLLSISDYNNLLAIYFSFTFSYKWAVHLNWHKFSAQTKWKTWTIYFREM